MDNDFKFIYAELKAIGNRLDNLEKNKDNNKVKSNLLISLKTKLLTFITFIIKL